jgi:glycosyltransferase involved in cell wall biosynthesis
VKHRLHVVSLPHTQTTAAYNACAYTQKVRKFGKMMTARGHEVFIYSGEENDAECTEHIVSVTKAQQAEWFGEYDQSGFYPITWDPNDVHWREMNWRASQQIRERAEPRDIVCIIAGVCQAQIAHDLSHLQSCEWGIGYSGTFSPNKCWESYAWMHYCYGDQRIGDGIWFDTVIPNFFDPEEFPAARRSPKAKPYLLYVGRLIGRKGVHIANQISKETGLPLKIAGQGGKQWGKGYVQADEMRLEGDIEYLGLVDIDQRAKLMSGAAAVLVPTTYIEPFGGVAVEAMMSGTPAITTDWGAFTETVPQGIGGYRFRTLGGGRQAVEDAMLLDRDAIRAYAHGRFSLETVGAQYEEWFDRLSLLWGQGWNDPRGPFDLRSSAG